MLEVRDAFQEVLIWPCFNQDNDGDSRFQEAIDLAILLDPSSSLEVAGLTTGRFLSFLLGRFASNSPKNGG